MEVECTSQPSASEAFTARATACSFNTGSAPGNARHTGHVLAFGASPKLAEQRQKILVAVLRCTCTSSPTTISYLAMTSGDVAVIDAHPRRADARSHTPRRTFVARQNGSRSAGLQLGVHRCGRSARTSPVRPRDWPSR